MPISMETLADDLAAESDVVRGLIAHINEDAWQTMTPAAGWNVVDQVSHLAHYDEVSVLAATDPSAFIALREEVTASGDIDPDRIALRYRNLVGAEMLSWYDRARHELLSTFRSMDPSTRVPWFGPSMSTASMFTARFMETWAHGQDLADTFGVAVKPTDRIRHVAHIGVGARPFSFAAHDRALPDAPMRVELTAPSGALWSWGPADATDQVRGPAIDFCLAVTQRRHLDDLSIETTGTIAAEWMSIAQAFAGEPGAGRAPRSRELSAP